jgi:large subunit ribosomal protein L25
MDKVVLKAESRQTGRHPVREVRDADRVPAVVYGKSVEPQAISLESRALTTALHAASGGLIEMEIAGQPQLHVLVREIQRHPTRRSIQHVDFMAVSMTQRVRLHISIAPDGQAPILSNQDMVLVRTLDAVEVECLPGDIPDRLMAPLGKLETVDDEVYVSDLIVPATVKVLTEPNHVIYAVTLSRAGAEEEVTAAPEAVSPDQVEVIKRKPKEEEA